MTERAYRYRFYPTGSQENLLRRTMGCVRLVYNKALATKTEAWDERQERVNYKQTSSLLNVGISSLLTTSDGDKISNPKHFNRLYQKLSVAQKELSRKTKDSSNRHKARLKVAKIQAKIKDARTDFLHKLITDLVRANSVIAIEDLAVRNMVKNHKLARSISDAAWGEMFRQLEYTCDWYGRTLVRIDRFFPSSKRCNHCGFVVDKLPLNVRSWDCPSCGTKDIDRDINAGKNILAAGLAVIVCGATVRAEQSKSVKPGAMKQKPKS